MNARDHPGSSQVAKLTGMVNFAVFAAFALCVGGVLLSNAEFKGSCGLRQLDVWCYGWQRWHDRGKKRQGCGNGWRGWVAKAAWWGRRCGHCQDATRTAAGGRGRRVCSRYAVGKVLAMRGGIVDIELKYHEDRGVSRGEPNPLPRNPLEGRGRTTASGEVVAVCWPPGMNARAHPSRGTVVAPTTIQDELDIWRRKAAKGGMDRDCQWLVSDDDSFPIGVPCPLARIGEERYTRTRGAPGDGRVVEMRGAVMPGVWMDRGWARMGERMRQETSAARARRGRVAAERERREEAAERAEREGEEKGERPLSRSWWRLLAGLTEGERLAVIQTLESWAWLVDELRAQTARMAVVDGAAEGRPAARERMGRGRRNEVLTRRELEVLGMAARGMKGPAIAQALSLSKETVHTHQVRTCAKLGASGTAAAVAKARKLGLI